MIEGAYFFKNKSAMPVYRHCGHMIYRANDIRAKLDETADTWIGACFFAKNVMKFVRELLCLIFEICGFKTLTEPIFNDEAYLVPVLLCSKLLKTKIN